MGRRALRRISPDLDLSRHFSTLEDLPRPFDPAAWLGRAAPLEVEVGSGKGLFISTAPAMRPEHNFIGIEIGQKYARFCAARLVKQNLDNARMIHGDARRFFAEDLADDSLAAVHVYFPDPWWKARHHKRRLLNDWFVKQVQRVLKPGGEFHFWTDVQAYYEATLETVSAATELQGPLTVEESAPEHDLDYRTHFERRVRRVGGAVYRTKYVKQRESGTGDREAGSGETMRTG